jgi:hypothetical protein
MELKGLQLTDSIFNTDNMGLEDLNITKNNVGANDTNSNTNMNNDTNISLKTGNSSWLDGIGDYFMNTNNSGANASLTNENDSMFSSGNIGSTLKGAGAIAGALSSIYGTMEQTKFNKEMLGMEKDRINRNIARQDKLQANYEGVWK